MRSNSIEEILQNKIDLLHKQIELEVKEKYHLYKRIKELNDEIAELKKKPFSIEEIVEATKNIDPKIWKN